MMAVDIETQCENYFSNLNPLAQKFAKDIKNIREAYQDLWKNLTVKEQSEIINENIISPAAIVKYARVQNPTVQDSLTTYSWFTKSQLDLFEHFKPNSVISDKNVEQTRSVNIRDVSGVIAANVKKESIGENKNSLSGRLQVLKPSVLKPKSPPPPPPIVKPPSIPVTDQNSSSTHEGVHSSSVDIPKTGFDFLDNW